MTSSARSWWRLGPAFAASDRRVIAVDQPGHGHTGHWVGHHRFRDNAADLSAFVRAAGLERPDLQVIGHSWGAMTVAALPAAGLRPATIVLLDPPAMPHAVMAAMVAEATDQFREDLAGGRSAIRAENPDWPDGDVDAKAEALSQLDVEAVRSVLLDNGDWDGGLADLADPAVAGVAVWLVRGDPVSGGLVPDAVIPAFERLIGADHILTIDGGHSPLRLLPVETTAALLHALGD